MEAGTRMRNTNVEDIYRLSPLQQGLLFHSLIPGSEHVYVVQFSVCLRGPLDGASLEEAWRRVVARHPVLRTSFHWENLQAPTQVVNRQVELPFERHDWRAEPAAEQETRFQELLRADRARGFDLTAAPLLRLTLARTG